MTVEHLKRRSADSSSAVRPRGRIVYLHQHYRDPEVSGGTRSYEFAKRLAARGFEVHVVATDQSGPRYRGWRTTQRDGFVVHRVNIPYSNRMTYPARIWAFARFAALSGFRARRFRSDLIFATSTPLTIIVPALVAKFMRSTPLVFEVRDLWPEVPIAMGALRGRPMITAGRWLERLAYRSSTHVVALSPGMKDGVVRTGVDPRNVSIIPNASDLEMFAVPADAPNPWLDARPELHGRPLALYCGTFGRVNGLAYLVDLAARTSTTHPELAFVAVGDGAEKDLIIARARELGVLGRNFFCYDPVPKRDLPMLLSAATVAMSLVIPVPELEANSANKFFDALASGKPVVLNYGGWQSELLSEHDAGISLSGRHLDEAARQLIGLACDAEAVRRLGENARALAQRSFARDNLATQLAEIFDSVLGAQLSGPCDTPDV